MNTHILNLATEPYESIKNGSKIIESRLYDEKRQQIKLGDIIQFTNREAHQEPITVEVIGLLRYKSFEELFTNNDTKKFGGDSIEWLLNQINQFYSAEDQQKYGVLGIQFCIK